jgi:hypothetical protein
LAPRAPGSSALFGGIWGLISLIVGGVLLVLGLIIVVIAGLGDGYETHVTTSLIGTALFGGGFNILGFALLGQIIGAVQAKK